MTKIKNKINLKTKFILWLIIVFGFGLRFLGISWDQGQHLHPDERFLTMVLTDIKIPKSIIQYFNPQESSLNPYNHDYSFFVYGSFPVNLIKVLGETFNLVSYDQIYLVGRVVTMLLDTLIILLIFLICLKISNYQIGLISSFLYAICVLPIQLSHFFTVDPFLNFFILLSFYFLIRLNSLSNRFLNIIFLSLSFSLALASKISAVYFCPIILLFFVLYFKNNLKSFLKYGFIFVALSILFFRFHQPQVFSTGNYFNWQLNSQFISNLKELKSYDNNPYYPPAIQWLKIIPIWFPLKNIILWGLGLPFGLIFISAIIFIPFFLFKNKFKNSIFFAIIIFWVIFLILFQGIQSVSTMRYFLPIYPFICILSGFFLNHILNLKIFSHHRYLSAIIFISLLIYPSMFLSIFLKSHPRVTASQWIYQNIPSSSVISTEYWDDALPLSIRVNTYSNYRIQELHVADIENDQKMNTIQNQLNNSNYIILSSNRFYKPIPQNSDIFPRTTKYYQSLFDGSLGFNEVAEFSSYPCFPPVGKAWFCLNDNSAEEAFTVYDHPKVIIFKKQSTN